MVKTHWPPSTGNWSALATNRANLVLQMQSAIDRGYDAEQSSRLNNVDWGGTLDAFVLTTMISGRPVSSNYWPEAMAAWSQTAGGPLRNDQLVDLANYVVNWAPAATGRWKTCCVCSSSPRNRSRAAA